MNDHLTPLRAAYVTQRQRAYHQSSRGIPTPEQRRAWEADADALIAAHDRETAARAWDEGAEAGYDDAEAGREEKHNPYRENL